MSKPCPLQYNASSDKLLKHGWWLLFAICVVYALFAFDMFRIELLVLIGDEIPIDAKPRQAPVAFLLHAVLGGIGLVAGALQFNKHILRSNRQTHRVIGWTYLLAIWGASLSGLWNTIYFDVTAIAKIIFWMIGSWWFISTTIAYLLIRARKIKAHRDWMIRSYGISLFIITFPIWIPTLQTVTSDEIAWPVGLALAAGLNAVIAEFWIALFQKTGTPEGESATLTPPPCQ